MPLKFRRWIKPSQILEDEVVVWVDVVKADEMWRRTDPGCYVGPGGTGQATDDRYQRIGMEFSSNAFMEMPLMSIDGAILGFTDGRHRFAWCRDHGDCCLPVITPAEAAEELVAFVGAACCGGSIRA